MDTRSAFSDRLLDAATLAARLAAAGGPLLAESLMLAHGGRAPRQPQDRAAGCYAPKLTKQDGRIDWSQDAEVVWHRQRAVTPWPGATTHFRHRGVQVTRAEPVRTHAAGSPPGTILGAGVQGVDVACAPGALRLLKLRPEGRAEMAASDWARGVRPEVRERFETMGASA